MCHQKMRKETEKKKTMTGVMTEEEETETGNVIEIEIVTAIDEEKKTEIMTDEEIGVNEMTVATVAHETQGIRAEVIDENHQIQKEVYTLLASGMNPEHRIQQLLRPHHGMTMMKNLPLNAPLGTFQLQRMVKNARNGLHAVTPAAFIA